jgi:endonuclease YncB( thermonuclease family)/very-short-patch-repair endonuclease
MQPALDSDRPKFDVKGLSRQLAVYELDSLLSTLGAGALKRRYVTKHAVSRQWTADFYVPEIRLAVDVEDSKARRQLLRRAQRKLACQRLGITFLRLTEAECWGDRDSLVTKLREAWRTAHRRQKHRPVSKAPALAACALLGSVSVLWLYPEWSTFLPQSTVRAEIVGRASVLDGDTIEIRNERIRFHGIDAPESGQSCRDGSGTAYRCGQRASFALADKIGAANVRCALLDRDHYRRHIGRCFLGAVDLNEWMVRQGQAVAYRRYSMDYVQVENMARQERIGVWQGEFELPWDWRQGNPESSPAVSSRPGSAQRTGCDIKGNISEHGKIYHLPGQRFYDRTRISPERGERWFCSEKEARAAGWRRARQ